MNPTIHPRIGLSRRLRSTPFTSRVIEQGVQAFTVYNHMLLPTEFISIEEDYWHLCSAVQVWDVGVERQISIKGPDATRLVQLMTPREVANVSNDRCVYLPLADHRGKLINDPIGIRLDTNHWWLSISDSDVGLWAKGIAQGAQLDVTVEEADVWPLAIQGPLAKELMIRVFGDVVADIPFFRHRKLPYRSANYTVAQSGWCKQGGYEIYVDDADVGQQLYDELFEKGQDLNVRPGCPNGIERLESTLLSYGNDMDGRHSVLESGLVKFTNLDADIDSLSVKALREERDAGPKRRLMGLILPAPCGPRRLADQPFAKQLGIEFSVGQPPEDFPQQGKIQHHLGSQTFSPRYQVQLATAMLDEPLASKEQVEVVLSDGTCAWARIVALPFLAEDLAEAGLQVDEIV